MPGKTNLAVILLLLMYTSMHAQQTQTGQLAQPTSSVYNRMRRMPESGPQQQAPQQVRQFPNPAQQFPPEQRVGGMQGQHFPRQPSPQQPAMNQPQNGAISPNPGVIPNGQPSAAILGSQQGQQPYGLALQPPNPPSITYANSELTIVANNSSLADIVSGIERATGVRVEGTKPDSERVFGQFGPGTPRDVLNSLFDGSRYDFILVGSLENPADVRTIILSPHGTAPAPGVNTANNQPYRSENNEEENEAAPVYQGGEGTPVQNVPPQQVVPPPTPPPSGQQQVKTPEQLLQELQRLRQQQQQQQQQTPR